MRQTKARKSIVELLKKGGIFSAQEIHSALIEYDLATIYRNLKTFVEEGIISELNIDRAEKKYEYKQDDHQHAVCSKCGKVIHLEIDKNELNKFFKLKNFNIQDIEVNIKGHCLE
ncbi:transcriptional repressor [Candidatus Dojkabacteria bacterium]|uniref:Transcriptional repressor n=1 Tax=Candidatus Dojkabacteria bacterium TaxID=2099670 RepID=A0A955L5A7_9BACT|nr:transcriptional repressor [Candidatus Dojkabacteria bacterium]